MLYTLDGQVVQFIKVEPINIELLTDEELESKMNFSSIEFSEEQHPYKILVIPRAVDISEHIEEQEELKKTKGRIVIQSVSLQYIKRQAF